jgi:hypothetical protein
MTWPVHVFIEDQTQAVFGGDILMDASRSSAGRDGDSRVVECIEPRQRVLDLTSSYRVVMSGAPKPVSPHSVAQRHFVRRGLQPLASERQKPVWKLACDSNHCIETERPEVLAKPGLVLLLDPLEQSGELTRIAGSSGRPLKRSKDMKLLS